MRQDERNSGIYDDMLQQRIGQALREKDGEESLDPQTLISWVAEEKRQKRQRQKRYALIACALLVCICAVAVALHMTRLCGSSVSMTGKYNDSVSETEDGAVIKGNQADADENLGSVKVTISDWEKVYDAQKEHPDMLIPEYVPEGYVFEKLEIEGNSLTAKYRFFFRNEKNKLEINSSVGKREAAVFDYDESIEVGNHILMVNTGERIVCCRIGENTIAIKGIIESKYVSRIIKNLSSRSDNGTGAENGDQRQKGT